MPTFIVATDLSERGDRALRRAYRMARETGAKLIVASVVDDSLPEKIAAALSAEKVAELDRIADTDPDAAAVDHTTCVLLGDPCHTIADLARDRGADLLILGVHRARPFLDAFRDTTMQRIVRLADCPVLLVRDPADKPYGSVLVAVDFSSAATAAAVTAHRIAPDARINAVHALHVPYEGLMGGGEKPFRTEAEAANRQWRKTQSLPETLGPVQIESGTTTEVLNHALTRYRPDLLAAGAHSRSGVAQAVLGSFATRLMREPPCDLLIAKPPRPAAG